MAIFEMAIFLRQSKCFLRPLFKPILSGERRLFGSSTYKSSSNNTSHERTFEELFRQSQFVKLGRPLGKTVFGNVTHIVNNELYIDMGWKFHAVVKVDQNNVYSQVYNVGDTVEVKINELEISGHFLGQFKRITLCEADVSLPKNNT